MPIPRFPIVVVEVSAEEADLASYELFELGATGIEVRDDSTLERGRAGHETLVASFPDEAAATAAACRLPAGWGPRQDVIVGDAWRDEYKKYFHPFLLCPGIVVRPPWEAYEPKEGERVLTLEPGRAFGTGLHETTSLVAGILAERAGTLAGRRVLDVGTGSGILGLVALLLGADRVRATDVDPEAVAVAQENSAANGMSERLFADSASLEALHDPVAVAVANIEAGVLADLAPCLIDRVEPEGLLVLSGILAPPASRQVASLLEGPYAQLEHLETKINGEWAALVLRIPSARSAR